MYSDINEEKIPSNNDDNVEPEVLADTANVGKKLKLKSQTTTVNSI